MSHHLQGIARWPRVVAGSLIAGTADLIFAMGFWWVAHQVPPLRILQSIGAGWYGDASFAGGTRTASVGAVSHFAIMFLFVAAYRLAAQRIPFLRAHPLRIGAVYGLGLYLVMNFVVLPLSAAGMAKFNNLAWVLGSIVMHVVIGVLCAYFALDGNRSAGTRANNAAGMPTSNA